LYFVFLTAIIHTAHKLTQTLRPSKQVNTWHINLQVSKTNYKLHLIFILLPFLLLINTVYFPSYRR